MHYNQVSDKRKDLILENSPKLSLDILLPVAPLPESNDYEFALAGLLTYSTFSAFPFLKNRNSGIVVKKLFLELTATGTAPDFNRIPFSSPSDKIQIHENQLQCKFIKKNKMRLTNLLFRKYFKTHYKSSTNKH